MNREEFGKLVRALRKERSDEAGNFWTQKYLAKKSDLEEAFIGRIEQGKVAQLTPDILVKLANSLELTDWERKPFFAAASGVDNDQVISGMSDPQQVIERCLNILNRVHLPAYVVDSYLDVIATNMATIYLYDLQDFRQWADLGHTINMLDVVFSSRHNLYKQHATENRFNFGLRNILLLRTRSLPYRTTPYFQQLLKRLYQYPDFRRWWQWAKLDEGDNLMGHAINMPSAKWGPLSFMTSIIILSTQYDDLWVLIYTPLTSHTQQAFAQIINESGTEAYQLSSWPGNKYSI